MDIKEIPKELLDEEIKACGGGGDNGAPLWPMEPTDEHFARAEQHLGRDLDDAEQVNFFSAWSSEALVAAERVGAVVTPEDAPVSVAERTETTSTRIDEVMDGLGFGRISGHTHDGSEWYEQGETSDVCTVTVNSHEKKDVRCPSSFEELVDVRFLMMGNPDAKVDDQLLHEMTMTLRAFVSTSS